MPLAGEVVRKSYLCPHAARGYRVKLQRQGYTAGRTTDNIYHEKSQLNRLVWSSLTLAPIMYHNLKNPPMGDKLKWLLKKGVGHIFKSCESDENFLSKICPPHKQLV